MSQTTTFQPLQVEQHLLLLVSGLSVELHQSTLEEHNPVMENAIVTDGCDLSDDSSTSLHQVEVVELFTLSKLWQHRSHQLDLSISTGDTVRWRQVGITTTQTLTKYWLTILHGIGSGWNLGSTYSKTFLVKEHMTTTVLCTQQCMVPLQ